MKYNDIVSVERFGSLKYQARVNWVEDGNVGVTFLTPKEVKGGSSVVKVEECTLISASAKNEMAEKIASISDKELEERINAIRRRRFPKATVTRSRKPGQPKLEREKKVSMDDIFKKMEENPKMKGE